MVEMTNREKVIKGLECCREMDGHACQKCPYISDCNNMSAGIPHLASDALELLKEQQETISSFQGTIRKLNAALEEQAEIVRCKDCKYCESPNATRDWCKKGHLHRNAQTWFCADGERK